MKKPPLAAGSTSPVPYAKLSAAEKEATALDRMREPELACPRCETKTTAADLPRHINSEWCKEPREPHPASSWIRRADALRWIPKRTLHRWARQGRIRQRGQGRGGREYLLRDVTRQLALRKAR